MESRHQCLPLHATYLAQSVYGYLPPHCQIQSSQDHQTSHTPAAHKVWMTRSQSKDLRVGVGKIDAHHMCLHNFKNALSFLESTHPFSWPFPQPHPGATLHAWNRTWHSYRYTASAAIKSPIHWILIFTHSPQSSFHSSAFLVTKVQKFFCFSLVNTCTPVYRNSLMWTTIFPHWFPPIQTIILNIGTHDLRPSLGDGLYFLRLCLSLPLR